MILARFHPFLGGTEKQALSLAKQLQQEGTELFVVTARLPRQKSFEEIDTVKIYRTASYFSGRIGSLCFMFSAFIFLWHRRRHFDLIHVFLAGSAALMAAFSGKLLCKKVVLKFGGAGPTGDIGTSNASLLGKIKLNLLKKYISIYVVPTREISDEIKQQGFVPAKIRHIANGVDIEKFIPVPAAEKARLRQELKLPGKSLILYAGRLEKGKGVDVLLAGWPAVCQQFPMAHLLILGEGTLRASLESQAKSLVGHEQIHFLGTINDLPKYLQCADIYILPSLAEGLSNALLEAMSSGLAIVASGIGGTCEVVTNGVNGLLTVPGDYINLSQKIIFLLQAPVEQKMIGQEARRTIIGNYNIESVAKKHNCIYQELKEHNFDTDY